MFNRRLLWQLYPSFLLVIVISVVGIGWYGVRSLRGFYLDQVVEDLKSRAHLVERQISSDLADGRFRQIDDFCKEAGRGGLTRITVILPAGEVIADSDEMPGRMENHSDRPEFREALARGSGSSIRFSDTLGKKMMYTAVLLKRRDEPMAVLRTSMPVTAIDESLGALYRKLFWAGLVIAACTAALSLAISKSISRPVERMTEAARHFASGKLDVRLSMPGAVELAELAKALNEMAGQLNARIDTISRERNRIQAILYSLVEGVLAVDSSGYVVSVNKAAASLLGFDPAAVQGLSVEEVIRSPRLQRYIRNLLDNGKDSEIDHCILQEGGRFLEVYGSSLNDNEGNNGAVFVLHDITRTRRLEEIRRDFVANVSHELKTPVTSIKGFVETLLDGAIDDPAQARRFLGIIAGNTDRLNAIMEDLLSLSRLEEDGEKRRLSFKKTAVRDVLARAVELSAIKAHQKNITLELQCEGPIETKMNSALIEQAVLNLIDNAVKYSRENSKVRIAARISQDEVIIGVSDQGGGIEKDHLDRIFERFYVVDKGRSRELGGTGLGLSIVKHIAQVHGGHVTVTSTPGRGSTFTIHLPVERSGQ